MERWVKQAGKRHVAKMRHLDDHHDIQLPRGLDAFTVSAAAVMLRSLQQVLTHIDPNLLYVAVVTCCS